MRRSICYCDPNLAIAGEVNTWKFLYTTAVSLPQGTLVQFDLASDARPIDWEIPTANLKQNRNVIYLKTEKGKVVAGKEVKVENRYTPLFQFVLPEKVEAGGTFTIFVGDKGKGKAGGTNAQTYAQRRRPFYLTLDPTGKGRFGEPEVFSLDVRGSDLHTIKVLTPSFVAKNKRFDIIVRFEDEFGNLTNSAPEDTLIELTYAQLRENLKWKLFVPETGFLTLPNLYFNEAGVYVLELRNLKTKETFHSSPIKCFPENDRNLFWGLLHGESERIDSTRNIESCLRHFRDDKAMNFFATSPFESLEETPNEVWKTISHTLSEFDEADRFTTFLGMQWQGTPKTEGLRHILYAKDQKPILRKKDPKYTTLKKLYKNFSPKEIIAIPSFTMGRGTEYNFDDFNPEFERVVEIYNAWGSSENTKKEGNPKPIKSPKKTGAQESPEGSVQKALLENKRFGFVGGGLDDRGVYATFFEDGQEQYTPGMTGIIATEHTRTALFEALYNRSCYATTGERIILGINLAGKTMGSEISTADKHGLIYNRHLSGYVASPTDIKSVEIVRNGEVIKTFKPEGHSFDFTYDDMESLPKVVVDAKDKKPPFVYYYLRVTLLDGHMAWSSPIWVDYIPGKPVKRTYKAPPRPPSLGFEKEVEEEEEDENDYDVDDSESEE